MSIELRYSENGDMYFLTVYGQHSTLTDIHANVSDRPEWLTVIVNIATLGEHFLAFNDPPPERVLWFFVDDDCNLVNIRPF